RNFDEVLRVIDSLQLSAKHKVSTPVNWRPGDDVIISGAVSDEEAKKLYPQGWKSPRPYIRIVPQPGGSRSFTPQRNGRHIAGRFFMRKGIPWQTCKNHGNCRAKSVEKTALILLG